MMLLLTCVTYYVILDYRLGLLVMKLKIHNSEVVSYRISGDLYYTVLKRADIKSMTVNEYARNALLKYIEYKENPNVKT